MIGNVVILREKLLDFLAERYASGTAKGFNVSHLGENVLSGYAPAKSGGNRLLDEDRTILNGMLEKLQTDGYLVLSQLKSEKSFLLYGGKFTDRMEEICRERGFLSVKAKSLQISEMLSEIGPDLRNEDLSRWADECSLVCSDGMIPTVPTGFWTYSDKAEDYIPIIRAADAVLSNTMCMFFRDFSMNVLHDSKLLEDAKVKSRVISLVLMCSDLLLQQEYRRIRDEYGSIAANDNLFSTYGIERVPHYVFAQADMFFSTSSGEVSTCGLPYCFSSAYVMKEYNNIHLNVDTFVCIENLTTYEDFVCGPRVGKLYTGGFLGVADKHLLRKIYASNRNVKFYHWSDIDVGGFRIFHDIQSCVPTIQPFRMDVEFMKTYDKYTKPLTSNDIDRLMSYDKDTFADVVRYMLDTGKKLEQESFYGG